jgi:ubiquinone/menaquinone biosynthesis C-methylase UbiE
MSQPIARFAGSSIPETYERHLGPLFFEPYALDLVARLRPAGPGETRILELACGTGRVTRQLLARLPSDGSLVATDLNEAMLTVARSHVAPSPRLEWRTVDAMALPFPPASFSNVVCQFGFMFFPDKASAARGIAAVLRPGGQLLFNTWDSLDQNPLARLAHETIAAFFANDPPRFYPVPFGYHDAGAIRRTLEESGFSEIEIERVPITAEAPSAEHAAIGLVRGSPVQNEIQERGTTDSEPIVRAVAAALRGACGDSPLRVPMQALVVSARTSAPA